MRSLFLLLAVSPLGMAEDVSWQQYGGTAAGTRHSPHHQIMAANVNELAEAWRTQTGDVADGSEYGRTSSFKATPVYVDGKLIVITGFNRVLALDAGTGKTLWRFDPDVDFSVGYSEMFTARGVAIHRDEDTSGPCANRVLFGTLDARLLAIDANTGQRCGDFGAQGEVNLTRGITRFRRGEYSVTSPPLVLGDTVVVGSSIGDNGAVALDEGTVRGFDVHTGELLWSWDPVPRSDTQEGAESWQGSVKPGAANVWTMMSGNPDSGLAFLPTSSPSPDFYGGERLGRNRFANSIVAVDARTGERHWDFQIVHHDLWDFDLASQPTVLDDGRVLVPTKMGLVFVLDQETGKPAFEVVERPVPASNVEGEQAHPTQPFPQTPPALHPPGALTPADVFRPTESTSDYCAKALQTYRHEGLYTPPSLEGTVLYPGNFGGTNWGSAAADPERQIAVMAINRLATVVKLIPRQAFDTQRQRLADDPRDIQFTAQRGTPYGMMRFTLVDPATGLPCLKGPWGELVAISTQTGDLLWRTPIGTYPALADHPEAGGWGTILSGGPIMTAAGLTIVASRADAGLHILDSTSGRLLRTLPLPAGAHATPMSYVHGEKQYVAIALGGKALADGKPGDYIVAFALDQ